ncbi:uncharacterized protein [Delphinus delphis]|uniref:Uncharacterized protein LOC109552378 isoform X1 n=1 Tax=Tursiops truncatus TaxID=9739 RepID=A0A2U4CGK5_TURTR|nr:uncharacterized protein LOC109552378 isoform X1 [Tursiops truncatus]XP_059869359.1 uncharacterized protein LOC132426587 isoform X1 [Delphinus delphis]
MIVSLAPACPAVCLQVRSRNAQLESVAEHPLPVSRIAEWDTRRRHLSFRGNLGKLAEGLQELALSSDSGLRRTADLLPGKSDYHRSCSWSVTFCRRNGTDSFSLLPTPTQFQRVWIQQVCVNWRKSDLPAWEKAMLEFALAISRADDITDDHFKKLEVHGFNQEDAWDIAAISAFYAMSNCLAHFVSLVPNKEFYLMGRTNDVKDIRSEPAAPKV